MDAREAAARDSAKDEDTLFQKLKPNHRPVVGDGSGPPKFEVPDVDDGKGVAEEDEERSIAGRKTMKMPKEKESIRLEGDLDDAEVKEELNDILKRSPSMCPYPFGSMNSN
jgi:hypothetical protein